MGSIPFSIYEYNISTYRFHYRLCANIQSEYKLMPREMKAHFHRNSKPVENFFKYKSESAVKFAVLDLEQKIKYSKHGNSIWDLSIHQAWNNGKGHRPHLSYYAS